MPKIALLVPTFYYGGSKRSVSNIAGVLSKKYDVVVVQFDTRDNVYSCDCEIVDLKCPVRKNTIARVLNRILRIIKYSSFQAKRKIDLSISFMDNANTVNFYAKAKGKRVISCRGFGDLLRLERRYVKMLDRLDGIMFNSKAMLSYFIKKHPNLAKKSFAVNNIYETTSFNAYLNEGELEQEFLDFVASHKTIVSVGRVSPEKGHTHLLRAFEILKETVADAGLVIIGDGPELQSLKEMANKSKHTKDILFCGFKNNPYKYVARCDLSALTSINEGFPNVVVEAMGCGLPVVCTNCKTGPNEILNEEYDDDLVVEDIYYADYGILTPVFLPPPEYSYEHYENSHKIYAKALQQMLTDDEIKNKYKAAAQKRFKSFSPEVIIDEYIAVIEKIMGDKTEK